MQALYYHNPNCTKSKAGLKLLNENNIPHTVRLYLDEAPTIDEIKNVLNLLNISAFEFIRKAESAELGLSDQNSEAELIQAIHDNPILFERPVCIWDGEAVIGRPADKLVQFLDERDLLKNS